MRLQIDQRVTQNEVWARSPLACGITAWKTTEAVIEPLLVWLPANFLINHHPECRDLLTEASHGMGCYVVEIRLASFQEVRTWLSNQVFNACEDDGSRSQAHTKTEQSRIQFP